MGPQNDDANLARIRDNQRRSRARRKEYQQELEQRVRAFEEQGVEASMEVQHAARRVAEENKKLRALLQHHGVSHARVEAYLRTGDVASPATDGAHVQTLEHLMVPRFPLQYTASPLLSGTLSAGPSSPGTTGGAGDDSSYVGYEGGVSPPAANGVSSRASHSHSRSHGHRSSGDKGKKSAVASTGSSSALTTTTTTTAAASNGYLSPGYGLTTTFYGLDATSAEDLQYSAAEPAFFDYSVSPQYLGADVGTCGGGSTSVTTTSMAGLSQPAVSMPYYGHVGLLASGLAGTCMRTCPACLSGMGCQVHGGFFDE